MEFHNFRELVEAKAKTDKVFMIQPEDGSSITYGKLKEEIEIFSKLLLGQGLKKGDKVALSLRNGISAGICILGVMYSGGTIVPVNPDWKKEDFTYILENSDSSFLITTDNILEDADVKINAKQDAGFKDVRIYKLKDGSSENKNENLLALMLYTSGTTGKPKGVMLSHENLIAETGYIRDGHKLTENDRSVLVLPLFHINGLVIGFLTPFVTGCTLIVPKKFSVSHFWEWIEKYGITWLSAVPTIISMVLARTPQDYSGAKTLRFLRSASAPLPVAVLDEFESRFHVPIIESFGISEGASQITTNPVDGVRKAGSVGVPVGNVVEIVRDDESIADRNEIGEVRIKGANIFSGYYNLPEETKKSLKNGWFYTGDLGWMDEDDYVFLKGRKKELINRAGEKFSPREIDEILYRIPQVELAAAVGVPDSLYNEEVVAFVKLKEDQSISEQEIIDFFKSKIAAYKIPKEVIFTDDLPKGPSGKVQRLKLVSRYEEYKKSERTGGLEP